MIAAVPVYSMPSPWQVTVGAEGIAAAQFARCGFDVSIQSGPEKPWYDLVVAKAGSLLKVSVRGSGDGSWALTQAYLKRVEALNGKKDNCKGAIDLWLNHHGSRSVCCLVQFKGVRIDELPRIYLASPDEVAQRLRETVERLGSPTLFERYEWTPEGAESPTAEILPSFWGFSEQRIQELLAKGTAAVSRPTLLPKSGLPARVWPPVAETAQIRQAVVGISA